MTESGQTISRPALAAMLLSAVAVTAFDDAFMVYEAARQMRLDVHRGILEQTATAPDRYRVLVPWIVEPVIRLLARVTTYNTAFEAAYGIFYLLGFAWLLWTLFAYLRIWFTEPQALVGALAAASTLRLTMQEYTPFSVLEPGFFALALILSYRQRRWWLGLVVLLASLNRETAVFLPLLYAVTSPLTKKNVVTAIALFATWAVVFVGVRLVPGDAYRYWTLDTIWSWNRNPEHLTLAAQNVVLLLGAFWLFAALGFRRSPPFVQRSAVVMVPYLATLLVWGAWSEVRLLTPLYPILFSLALSYLFRPGGTEAQAFRRPIVIAALLATVAGVNAYQYSFLVPQAALRRATHQGVLTHTADVPERFHVLVPFAVEAAIRPAATLMPHEKAVGRVYAVYYFAALWGLLFALFTYLTLWFSGEEAMIGTLVVADTIRVALRQGEYIGQAPIPSAAVFAPHSILEPTLIAVALMFIVRRRRAWLAVLVAVAALNSEAALLIPLIFLAGAGVTKRTVAAAAGYTALALAAMLAVRLWSGGTWVSTPFAETWRMNVAQLPTVAINVMLFLGGVWLLALFGFPRAPAFLRRVAIGVPVCIAAVAVWGFWWDVRLLMPLYPMVVPLALGAMKATPLAEGQPQRQT